MANSVLQTDVVIIGGGGAGIPAAIEVARAGGKAHCLGAGRRMRRHRGDLRRRLLHRRHAAAKSPGHQRHARSRFRGLGEMGRRRGRRSLGAVLSRTYFARSLSLGGRLRRQMGRHENSGRQQCVALAPAR